MSEQTNYINLDTILGEKKETVKDQVIVIQEAITPSTPTRIVDWDSILNEVSYKLPKGYPTVVDGVFTEREEIIIINEALEAEGLSTLPLPEVDKAKPVKKYQKGFINNTGTKEGLVMYFATQETKTLIQAANKIINNTATQLKFNVSTITSERYDGVPKGSADTKADVLLLNTSTDVFSNQDKQHYLNAISSAKYIHKKIGVIDSNLIDRGAIFNTIRKQAKIITEDMKVGLDVDKWCPGDIYIYSALPDEAVIEAITTLSVGEDSLNALFMDKFAAPKKGKILAISLKEAVARGGKATSFRKVLKKGPDYPTASDLPPDLGRLKDVVTQINAFKKGLKNSQGMLGSYGELSDAEKNLIVLAKSKKYQKSASTLLIVISKTLKKVLGAEYQPGLGKDKVMKISKALVLSDKLLSILTVAVDSFLNEVYAVVYAVYNNSRDKFISSLKTDTYDVSESKPIPKANNTEDLGNSVETLLKKANCYIVAIDLISNLSTKLKIPKTFTSLANQKNPFIALAAFAMSQTGLSPSFYKLVGSDDIGEIGVAHTEFFPSNGILSLPPKTLIKIQDTVKAKGIGTTFTVSQYQNKKEINKYIVDLGFLYSGTSFKIEINEIK